jgi:uncharacterized membrane protein
MRGAAVIETGSESVGSGALHWVLRPNQSLSRRQTAGFFLLVALTSVIVVGFSWAHGNVFAPVFALLQFAFLAFVFRLVWKRAARAEVIRLDPQRLSINRLPEGGSAWDMHPNWVRVEKGQRTLVLASGHQRVAVGSFLGETERETLLKDLERGLRDARARGSQEFRNL